ncbi:MAG TPA: hypothetical protein VMZ30_19235, partial [Pyrinomonadaceae bacterium]|nr:hypothetical protein [Pyrinomonadaceae bacterium]
QRDNEISIPAFLLNATDSTVAYLNSASDLVVAAASTKPAGIENLEVPAGRWRVQVEGQTEPLRVRISRSRLASTNDAGVAADRILLDTRMPAVLELAQGGALTIQVFPETEGAIELKQLQLTRVDE